jgi:hypothetical protein
VNVRQNILCEVSGSHSRVAEDLSPPVCMLTFFLVNSIRTF